MWYPEHVIMRQSSGQLIEAGVRGVMNVLPALLVVIVAGTTTLGCKQTDRDEEARNRWMNDRTASRKVFLRRALKGSGDVWFYDGWYPMEADPKSGGAWRWQEKKSTTRFRTSSIPAGDPVRLSVFGWTDFAHLDVRTSHLDFYVNGVRIERFDTPSSSFEHVLQIPRRLIGNGEWVDMNIVAANTTRPAGEWRDLGFSTTGFLWRGPEWIQPPEAQ